MKTSIKTGTLFYYLLMTLYNSFMPNLKETTYLMNIEINKKQEIIYCVLPTPHLWAVRLFFFMLFYIHVCLHLSEVNTLSFKLSFNPFIKHGRITDYYTQQIKIYMGHNMTKCTFRHFFFFLIIKKKTILF